MAAPSAHAPASDDSGSESETEALVKEVVDAKMKKRLRGMLSDEGGAGAHERQRQRLARKALTAQTGRSRAKARVAELEAKVDALGQSLAHERATRVAMEADLKFYRDYHDSIEAPDDLAGMPGHAGDAEGEGADLDMREAAAVPRDGAPGPGT